MRPIFIIKVDGHEVARLTGDGIAFGQRAGADDTKLVKLERDGQSIFVLACSTQKNVVIEKVEG